MSKPGRNRKDVAVTQVSWVNFGEHFLWPVTVIVLVIVLRRQIGDFLSAVGGRITHVSVMSVTVELAVATETTPPWRGIGGDDVRGLVPANRVVDSYFGTLRQSLLVPGTADFFVVDLKSDGREEWLTSRLYLFAYVLSRLKGVRTIVFTATRGDVAGSFLGIAEPEEILPALAAAEPWLREARLQVEAKQVGWLPSPVLTLLPADPFGSAAGTPATAIPDDIDEWWQLRRANSFQAGHDPLNVPQQFLECIQWRQPQGGADPVPGWLQLPSTSGPEITWEHASWITASDLTDGRLRNTIQPDGYVIDNRSWSVEQRVRAVAQGRGDFVALLGPTRRFERLIDRRALLEALGIATANAS